MTSTSVDPSTGAKRISDADAPDTAGNYNELADQIVAKGLAGRGTTAQRDAYAFAKEGDLWSNTTTDVLERYNGTAWDALIGAPVAAVVSGAGGATTTGTRVVKTADGWVKGHISLRRDPLSSGEGVTLGIIQGANRPTARYTVPAVISDGGSAVPVVAVVLTNGNIQYFGTPGGNKQLDFDIQYLAAV